MRPDKYIKTNMYTITSLLFCIMFLFPIMRNAVQSITLIAFLSISVLFYHKNFLTRIKNRNLWKNYGILTGFFWFSALTFFWTDDKFFFFNELRPSIAIAFVPFVMLFFHPKLLQKTKELAIVLFLISLIIYAFLWFFHHVEGISIYQEIISKESPLRDESIVSQIRYFLNRNYKYQIGGLSIRGYELLGKNSFFSHSNYISSYYLFGFILSVHMLFRSNTYIYRLIAITTFGISILFLYYLSSKLNILLFGVFVFGIIVYFLKTTKLRIIFFGILIITYFVNRQIIVEKFNELQNWEVFEKQDNNMDGKIVLDYKRTKIYTCTLHQIKEHYLLGIGLGDVQRSLDVCLAEFNLSNPFGNGLKEYNTHSQFLHFAIVGGIPNFVLFLGVFIYLILVAFRQKNKLLLTFTLIVLTNCFFENYISRVYGVLFFVLFSMALQNFNIIENKEA